MTSTICTLPGRARTLMLPILAIICTLVVGCSRETASSATQVAAKVNDSEISVHQVQHALQRRPRAAADQSAAASQRTLDVLVEQELAAQAARAQGLERDPRVVQGMEAAKRDLLARAYQEQLVENERSPTAEEIDAYYESKPALFSKRRLYTLQEFAVAATEGDQSRLQDMVNDARNVEDLVRRLRLSGLTYQTRQLAQSAEDLPMGILEAVAALEEGRSVLLPTGSGARIVTIVRATVAPLSRKQVANSIAAYLNAERKRKVVAQGMQALRNAAKIEYQGSFARPATAQPLAAHATGVAATP